MAKRRAWVTPDSPVPDENRGRCFSVPNDPLLVGAVTGALLPLTVADNWEEAGTMTPVEAADLMSAAFEEFVNGECGSTAECVPGGTVVIKRGANGRNVVVDPDSGEWVTPSGDMATPAPESRPEETEADQKCGAASNAANVLKTLYLGMVTAFDESADNAYGIAQLALYVATTLGSGLGAQVTAFLALTDYGFSVFYAAIETIAANYWTDDFTDVLVCLLQDNLTIENGVATFNFQAVMYDLVGFILPVVDQYTGVRWQVWYLLQFIGADGLDLAGATQAVEGDCVTCGEWCYISDDWSQWTRLRGGELINGDIRVTAGNVAYGGTIYGTNNTRYAEYELDIDTSRCEITGFQWSIVADASNQAVVHSIGISPTDPTKSVAHYWPANYSVEVFKGWGRGEFVSTDDITTLYISFCDGTARAARGLRWRVYGNGVNPFAVGSNC